MKLPVTIPGYDGPPEPDDLTDEERAQWPRRRRRPWRLSDGAGAGYGGQQAMTDHLSEISRALRVACTFYLGDMPKVLYDPQKFIAALAAEGLVIVDKEDVLWLRALRDAGVDNWEGIEYAIDLRADMEADDG